MSTDELYLPSIVIVVVSIVMIFGDVNIILATLRFKSLKNPCNFLIAFNAFSGVVLQFGIFVYAYYLFSGVIYTTRLTCVYWQSVPIFSSMFGLTICLAIGIDRMIGVVLPFKYRQLPSKAYVFILVLLSLIYASIYIYANYQYNLLSPNDTVICWISGASHPSFNVPKNIAQGILCGSIIVVYSITWSFLLMKKTVNNNLKQFLKPLTIIMCMVVFTWPFIFLASGLIHQYLPTQNSLTIGLYMVWVTQSGRASDYFIFFAFSRDYRKAFLRQLSWVPYFGKFTQSQTFITTTVLKAISPHIIPQK